jgi:hypothetical protein
MSELVDATDHNEGCAFITPRNPGDTVTSKSKKWFDFLGFTKTCPICEAPLEFKDEA